MAPLVVAMTYARQPSQYTPMVAIATGPGPDRGPGLKNANSARAALRGQRPRSRDIGIVFLHLAALAQYGVPFIQRGRCRVCRRARGPCVAARARSRPDKLKNAGDPEPNQGPSDICTILQADALRTD